MPEDAVEVEGHEISGNVRESFIVRREIDASDGNGEREYLFLITDSGEAVEITDGMLDYSEDIPIDSIRQWVGLPKALVDRLAINYHVPSHLRISLERVMEGGEIVSEETKDETEGEATAEATANAETGEATASASPADDEGETEDNDDDSES